MCDWKLVNALAFIMFDFADFMFYARSATERHALMCAGVTTAQQSLAPVAQHTPQPIAPAATTRITLMVYYARRFD